MATIALRVIRRTSYDLSGLGPSQSTRIIVAQHLDAAGFAEAEMLVRFYGDPHGSRVKSGTLVVALVPDGWDPSQPDSDFIAVPAPRAPVLRSRALAPALRAAIGGRPRGDTGRERRRATRSAQHRRRAAWRRAAGHGRHAGRPRKTSGPAARRERRAAPRWSVRARRRDSTRTRRVVRGPAPGSGAGGGCRAHGGGDPSAVPALVRRRRGSSHVHRDRRSHSRQRGADGRHPRHGYGLIRRACSWC